MTTFGESLQALASAQKVPRGAPAYSRWVNRRVGRVFAAAASVAGWSPDRVTVCGSLCTFTAISVVAGRPPSIASAVVVTGLLVVGYALDSADGQLARLRGLASAAGEWLDHVLDAAKILLLHLAVAVNWYLDDPGRWVRLVLPVCFAVVASVLFAAHVQDARVGRAPLARSMSSGWSVVRSLLVLPTDYGVVCLSFAFWWWQSGFVVLYGVLAAVTFVFAAVALPVWYLQLRELAGRG